MRILINEEWKDRGQKPLSCGESRCLFSVLRVVSSPCGVFITLCSVELNHEALGREERGEMNIQEDAVFLVRVTLEALYLEFLNQTVRPLDAVKELDDLAAQVALGIGTPVLECAAVEEVKEHLSDVVKDTNYGVSLQTEVVAIEQGLGRECHHLAVFVHHRNQAHLFQFGDFAFLQLE